MLGINSSWISRNQFFQTNLTKNRRSVSNKIHQVISNEAKKTSANINPSQFLVSNLSTLDALEGKREAVQRQFEMFKQGFEKPLVEKYKTKYEERIKERNRKNLLDYYQSLTPKKFSDVGEISILPENASQLFFHTLKLKGREKDKFFVPIAKMAEAERIGILRNPKKNQQNSQLTEKEREIKDLVDQIESTEKELEMQRQKDEKIRDQVEEEERLSGDGDVEPFSFQSRLDNAIRLEQICEEFITKFEQRNVGRKVDMIRLRENHSFLQNYIQTLKGFETNKQTDMSAWPNQTVMEEISRFAQFETVCKELIAVSEENQWDSLAAEVRMMLPRPKLISAELFKQKGFQDWIAQINPVTKRVIDDPILSFIHNSFNVVEARQAITKKSTEELQDMYLKMRKEQISDPDSGEVENILFSTLGLESPFPGGKFTPEVKQKIKQDRIESKKQRKEEILKLWPPIEIANPFKFTVKDAFNRTKMLPQETENDLYVQRIRLPAKENQDHLFVEDESGTLESSREIDDDDLHFEDYEHEDGTESFLKEDEAEEPTELQEEFDRDLYDEADGTDYTPSDDPENPSDQTEEGEERTVSNTNNVTTLVEQFALKSQGESVATMKEYVGSAVIPHELYNDEGYDPMTAQIGLSISELKEIIKEELVDQGFHLKGPEADAEKAFMKSTEEKLLEIMSKPLEEIQEGIEQINEEFDALLGQTKEAPISEFENVPYKNVQLVQDEYAPSLPQPKSNDFNEDNEEDTYSEDTFSEFNLTMNSIGDETALALVKQNRTQAMDPYHGMNITSQGKAIVLGEEYPVKISYFKEPPSIWENDRWAKLRRRKARLQIYIPSLKLSPPALQRLHEIATGKIKDNTLTIIIDRDMETIENIFYAKRQAQQLIEEAWKADPAYVPYSANNSYAEEQTNIDLDQLFNQKAPKQKLTLFHVSE